MVMPKQQIFNIMLVKIPPLPPAIHENSKTAIGRIFKRIFLLPHEINIKPKKQNKNTET